MILLNHWKISKPPLRLTSWRSYFVFLAITASLVNLVVMAFSYWRFFLLCLWLIRLIFTRQQRIIRGCFFIGLTFLVSGLIFNHRVQEQQQKVNLKQTQVSLSVEPLDIKVDGDYLNLKGISLETKQTYFLHYQLKNQREQHNLASLTDLTIFNLKIKLAQGEGQRNLNGFDYQNYLIEEGIYAQGEIKSIESYQQAHQPLFKLLTSRFKARLRNSYIKRLPPLTSSYLSQLTLGTKEVDLKSTRLELSLLGISRLLSLSGLQIFYFLRLIRYCLLRLGVTLETTAYLEISLLLIFLLFFWGSPISLMRSLLYLLILKVNLRLRLGLSDLDCWSISLLIALVINPYLWTQASGQLSFCLSFYWLALSREREKSHTLKKTFILSGLSVPLLAYHFYQWHLFNLVLTPLVVPLFIYCLWPLLFFSYSLSFLARENFLILLIEKIFISLNQLFVQVAQIKPAQMVTGVLPLGLLLFCIAVTLFILSQWQLKAKIHYLLLLLVMILPSSFKYLNPQGLIAFVDVGQGDSLFIQRPFHRGNYLIDLGGRLLFPKEDWAQRQLLEQQLTPFLKSRGVKKLAKVYVTHGDQDHRGNLLPISNNFQLKELIYPAGMTAQELVQRELNYLHQQGTKLSPVLKGVSWQLGEVKLTSLAPFEVGIGENKDSLVLSLELKNKKILLMADLEGEGETQLSNYYQSLNHDILAVGHHGSRTSTTKKFLAQVNPEDAIISVGKNNQYGHPHLEVLSNLREEEVRVFRTDLNGMIYYKWYPWEKEISLPQTIK